MNFSGCHVWVICETWGFPGATQAEQGSEGLRPAASVKGVPVDREDEYEDDYDYDYDYDYEYDYEYEYEAVGKGAGHR